MAGLALLVPLGGCDSAGRGGGDGAGGEAGSPSSAAPAPGGIPESRAWIERPELPFDYYSDLFIQAQLRASDLATADGGAWEAEQEEFIASCMKAEGFEYFPRVADGAEEDAESMIRVGDRRLWVPWLPEDLADVEKYGYGMLESETGSQDSLGGSGAPDRNAEYTAALSASALREYRVALLGAELADYDLAAVDSVPMPEMGGCMGGANEAHPYP
ncbi:MAG: hypothetical protein LBE08_05400, partial [Bifidobacteriaceae bacterium]|nr:hypothetical protein [Bifidobacteriaceae bacterium]